MSLKWEAYKAEGGTTFTYETRPDGRVGIIPVLGDTAMVPITDLVEFVEVVYHGSELELKES
jgi:hypothetical protein